MQHPDEGTIHAWLDGQLPLEEGAVLEAHAAECAQCSSVIAEARGLVAASSRIVTALDDVPAGVIPLRKKAARSWYSSVQFRAAAAVLFVAGASALLIRGRGVEQFDEAARPVSSITAAAVTPDGERAAEPAQQASTQTVHKDAVAPAPAEVKRASPPPQPVSILAATAPEGYAANTAAGPVHGEMTRSGVAALPRAEPVVVTAVAADALAAVAEKSDDLRVVSVDSLTSARQTVYAVSEGVEVILTESPAEAVAAGRAVAATLRNEDRVQRSTAAAPLRARAATAAVPPREIYSITWTDSATMRMNTLSGPVAVERLEQIRAEIERRRKETVRD